MRNLYAELAEYTKRPQTLVEARSIHASVELAWQFEKHKGDPLKFYRQSDLYIFALTRYQMQLQVNGIHSWYKQLIKSKDWKTGLDYGGGIGEQTILGVEAGAKMKFLEVQGGLTFQYALWRFSKHKMACDLAFEDYKVGEDFDFVVAMDVFEHMENPQPVIEKVAKHTKYLFCNPNEIKYNWLYPQHISQYSLTPYFREVENYLYESKMRR